MIIFKTRHELRELKREVQRHNDIMDALRAHFDLKYTMEDFQRYFDDVVAAGTVSTEQIKEIPVSVGEFLHLYEMLSPVLKTYFRGVEVKPSSPPNNVKDKND